jgi:hypothetical protein
VSDNSRALLPLLALLAGAAPARAGELEVSARAGISLAAGDRVTSAPALGLSARYALDPRLRLEIGAERAVHALTAAASSRLAAYSATAGLQAGLDLVPVIPIISAGVAYQYATRLDKKATASTPGYYLAVGLRARVVSGLTLSGQVRYLSASFSASGLPSYTSFLAEVGWAVP